MRSIAIVTIACLHFGVGNSHADDAKKPLAEASLSTPLRLAADQEQRVLHSLSQRIKVEVEDAPLIEVIHFISQMIDREILIDTQALADGGISTDQSTTLNLGEMTVWQTLHFLLKPFQLAWTAHDGILEITTESKAQEQMVTRVYDVRKLCELLEPISKEILWQRRPKQPNDAGIGGPGGGIMGGGMGGGGGYFSVPVQTLGSTVIGQFGGMAGGAGGVGGGTGSNTQTHRSEPVSLESMSVESLLARLIMPLTSLKWMETDGEGGSVQVGQGILIVWQTYQGQFQIAGILKDLERIIEGKTPRRSSTIQRIDYPHQEDAAIFASLAKLKNLEIDDQDLKTALQQIGAEAGCRLLIDFPSLADEGISSDQPVKCHLQKLPLGICLKKVLEPLQLTHVVHEGVLVITTVAKAAEMMSIRVYDVSGCNKIPNDFSPTGLLSILVQSTSGKWQEMDGEGGGVSLISSKHLLVRQTQRVHSEIEFLIDELASDKSGTPAKPVVKMRIYTAPDIETATDLLQVLPRVLEKDWVALGSINQAGKSLLINQTPIVHDQIEEIMNAMEASRRKQNPTSSNTVSPPHTNPTVSPPNTNPPAAK